MPYRLLYIDESLSNRIAAVLRQRGRNAKAASELGFVGLKDEPLLRKVYGLGEDVVFVTADDDLPREHPGVVREVRATVATVRPYDHARPWPTFQKGLTGEESWKRDAVQRWAHVMQDMERGTKRRFSPVANTKWTPKIRKPR